MTKMKFYCVLMFVITFFVCSIEGQAHCHHPAWGECAPCQYPSYERCECDSRCDECDGYTIQEPECGASYTYLRFGAARMPFRRSNQVGPSVHVGRRYSIYDASVDLSANWAQSNVKGEGTDIYLSAPRIAYLRYMTPPLRGSFFVGPAISWVYMANADETQKFNGVALEGSCGFEFSRLSTIRAIVQLDISQPILASRTVGDLPRPIFTFSFGAGF